MLSIYSEIISGHFETYRERNCCYSKLVERGRVLKEEDRLIMVEGTRGFSRPGPGYKSMQPTNRNKKGKIKKLGLNEKQIGVAARKSLNQPIRNKKGNRKNNPVE